MKTSIANALGHAPADKRIEILRLIGQTGSISQAAREAGVSYKAAWQALDTLSNLSGVKLVEKMVGGSGGGGAQLTAAGHHLLATADLLEKVRHEVLEQLQAGQTTVSSATLSQLAIRTSMRNHLPCLVQGLEKNGQIVRVTLTLPCGGLLVSRITRASAELLALAVGQQVLALFKATAVQVTEPLAAGSGDGGANTTGKNRLAGTARRVSPGPTEDEISVAIGEGIQLVGFADAAVGIQHDSAVQAIVDESAVVIALIE
jgi:molybdate transport system regulatory protein